MIVGEPEDNDALIAQVPPQFAGKACPVWHMHEPIPRLVALCEAFPKVGIGSSGAFVHVGTAHWHKRMTRALMEIYGKRQLTTRLHGLRMLDGRILGNYPLHSADSTNLACNVPKFEKKYPHISESVINAPQSQGLSAKELKRDILRTRCAVLKNAIELVKPPSIAAWLDSASN